MSFLPLAGIKVVDMTSSLAGPYCTLLLGALGADVVKVEHPERGDEARAWGPPFWSGESTMFLGANSGKRSFGLDVKDPRGKEAAQRLIDSADVFVQSLRAGTAEKLGLGGDEMRARNPRLVYCNLGAFGRKGPLAMDAGYDPLLQAFSGIMSVTGEAGRGPVRAGVSLIDQGTGTWAAFAILAALWERERTGAGCTVDVSLFETALGYMANPSLGFLATGKAPRAAGTGYPSIVPYQVFAARDGNLMVAAANNKLYAALCGALGLDALVTDPRFKGNPDRVANKDELIPLLETAIAARGRDELVALLRDAGVPAAPVQDAGEVWNHPQTDAIGIKQRIDHPDVPDFTTYGVPFQFDGERPPFRGAPPRLGEHSRDVLGELGYSADEISVLEGDGVITKRD